MNINIKNNSGHKVYAIIFGQDQSGDWCFFKGDGLHKCKIGEDTHKYFYKMASSGNLTLSTFPLLSSGVILFSYDEYPQIMNVVKTGTGAPGIQTPPFTPGTPDATTIFNMVEFTYDANGLNVDTTNVDYYVTPITIRLQGKDSGHASYDHTAGKMAIGRDAMFTKFQAETVGTDFSGLIMTGASGNVRILGPQHGVQAGFIPTTYYDAYISACWDIYKTETLTVYTSLHAYEGNVDNTGSMNFCLSGSNTILYSIPKPPVGCAFDVLGCCNSFASPNNEYGAIVARIGAALNRTVLHSENVHPYCDETGFYSGGTNPTNLYAKILHECYKNGNGYAFPFDDVCNVFSSDMGCYYPAIFTINLEKF